VIVLDMPPTMVLIHAKSFSTQSTGIAQAMRVIYDAVIDAFSGFRLR